MSDQTTTPASEISDLCNEVIAGFCSNADQVRTVLQNIEAWVSVNPGKVGVNDYTVFASVAAPLVEYESVFVGTLVALRAIEALIKE